MSGRELFLYEKIYLFFKYKYYYSIIIIDENILTANSSFLNMIFQSKMAYQHMTMPENQAQNYENQHNGLLFI